MRTVFALLALVAPALAGRVLLEEAAAAAAAAPTMKMAEAALSFDADKAVLKDGTLTFTAPSEDVVFAPAGDKLKTAEAFAPGKFEDPALQADGVISGKNAAGEEVKTIVRFSEPIYYKGNLLVKAVPLAKDAAPKLAGGEVAKAQADPATFLLPESGELTGVKVVVDSTAPPKKADEAAAAATGRRLSHWGDLSDAYVGAVVMNHACDGSFVCAAAGAQYGYNHGK